MKLDTIINQPLIEGDRFDLRPLRKSDQGLIEHYAGDERVARMTSTIPHPYPPTAAEAFVARSMDENRLEDIWAIDGTRADAPELMGILGLKKLDRAQAEISFWVAPPFWNTGLASAAVLALIEANPQENNTLFATVFQDNPASARVLTHCGFDYIGDAESFSVARDATVATWTYSRKL